MKPTKGRPADSIRQQMRPLQADTLLFGPVVLDPDDDSGYFVLIIGRHHGRCRTAQIRAGDGLSADELDEMRGAMVADLAADGGPLVLHDFDDEVRMMEAAAHLWPRYQRVLAAAEAERASGGSA